MLARSPLNNTSSHDKMQDSNGQVMRRAVIDKYTRMYWYTLKVENWPWSITLPILGTVSAEMAAKRPTIPAC